MYPPLNKGLQGTSNEAGVDFGGSRRKKKEGGGRFRAISFQSDLCAIPSRKASLFSQQLSLTRPDILRPRDFFLYPRARRLPRRGKKRAEEKSVMKYVGRGEREREREDYTPRSVRNTTAGGKGRRIKVSYKLTFA